MRNRSYDKLKILMQVLLNQNFVNRLNQYIVENEGDKDSMVRLILLKLSQYINKNEVSFETEDDLELFIGQYIKSEVDPRIGDPIDDTYSQSFHN